VSSPATIADECLSENQAARLQYLHIPQDLHIGVNKLITESLLSIYHEVILTIIVTQAHNQHVREMALLSMQVQHQNQLLWLIFNMLRNQTQASIISDKPRDSSSKVQQ
jgi:hypothetical protein